MCRRYASILSPALIARVFGAAGPLPNYEITWNRAPTKDAPVVLIDPEAGERRIVVVKWGLVTAFTKDLAKARKPINARCETVARSPLFKGAFAQRRCLVPVAAYYEWRHDPTGKMPFTIARKDGEPVAFGGMWEEWRSQDGGDASHLRDADNRGEPRAGPDPGSDAGDHRASGLAGVAR
jgi:putative SOS response-associated peptidase YedK